MEIRKNLEGLRSGKVEIGVYFPADKSSKNSRDSRGSILFPNNMSVGMSFVVPFPS